MIVVPLPEKAPYSVTMSVTSRGSSAKFVIRSVIFCGIMGGSGQWLGAQVGSLSRATSPFLRDDTCPCFDCAQSGAFSNVVVGGAAGGRSPLPYAEQSRVGFSLYGVTHPYAISAASAGSVLYGAG